MIDYSKIEQRATLKYPFYDIGPFGPNEEHEFFLYLEPNVIFKITDVDGNFPNDEIYELLTKFLDKIKLS